MAVLESWLQGAREGIQNAAASTLPSTAPDNMPSLRTLSKIAFGGAQMLVGSSQQVLGGPTQACPNPQLSCHNTTVVENLCCFNAPGGQMLQTQFWDTDPSTGPVESWTIHGLWPDRCDGTYDANCDSSRVYNNISAIISSFGKDELLKDMSTYWKDYKGDDETFWEHEWSKHGTCISTLEPQCYTDHKQTEEVVDYFQKAVDLYKTLPSYEWLKEAGITPSTSKTYTFEEIQSALAAKRPGVEVTLGCKSGRFNEIWYHFDVRGSVQSGEFVPSDPDGTKSSCPKTGIKYLPKNGDSDDPAPTVTRTTVPSQPTSTGSPGTPFNGKGFLNVEVDGAKTGCIVTKGTWYTTGACATFTATDTESGFTLSSSKGKCGIVSGALTCGGSVRSPTGFTNVDGKLAVGSNTAWSADKQARGTTQETVFPGGDHANKFTIVWQGK